MRRYPSDTGLERAVLWYLTETPADILASGLEIYDFHDQLNQKWWELITTRYVDGRPVHGIMQLKSISEPHERYDTMLKMVFEVDVTDWEMVTLSQGRGRFLQSCQRLRMLTYQRELAKVGGQLIEVADDPEAAEDAHLSTHERMERLRSRIGMLQHQSLVDMYRQELSRGRVPTTYQRIDGRVKGGIPRGGIMFAIARPSVGKTTWAANLALRVSRNMPAEHVVFVTTEQPAGSIVEKLMMADLMLEDEALAAALENPDEARWPAGRTIADFEAQTPNLHVWEDTRTIEDVQKRVAALDGQTALVVVDYIQQLRMRAADEYEGITTICRELRPLAIETKSAVLALSQLTRQGKKDKCPQLETARGSGAIEEVGDIVIGLWRPEWDAEQEEERPICDLRCTILKQKWGYLGTVPFRFDMRLQRTDEVRWANSVAEEESAAEDVGF